MINKLSDEIKLMEGRTYIIGREGHIYVQSLSASKYHAAVKIYDGRIYLRDLNSTNGTYLLKGNIKKRFEEGYVSPHQVIMIGGEKHAIHALLAIAGEFTESEDTRPDSTVIGTDNLSALGSLKRFFNRRSGSRRITGT
jgi:pSer/pThr/pTyr-binding forkhead associated (FHA) protein